MLKEETEIDKYKSFLLWLISPQDDNERELFKDVIDDHCDLVNRMDNMNENELIDEINNQLEPYDLELNA